MSLCRKNKTLNCHLDYSKKIREIFESSFSPKIKQYMYFFPVLALTRSKLEGGEVRADCVSEIMRPPSSSVMEQMSFNLFTSDTETLQWKRVSNRPSILKSGILLPGASFKKCITIVLREKKINNNYYERWLKNNKYVNKNNKNVFIFSFWSVKIRISLPRQSIIEK